MAETFNIDYDALQDRIHESMVREREKEREAEEVRLRPPASHPCVVCGGKLTPTVETEAVTRHTVIGSRARRWHSGYECQTCHLVYSTSTRATAAEGD